MATQRTSTPSGASAIAPSISEWEISLRIRNLFWPLTAGYALVAVAAAVRVRPGSPERDPRLRRRGRRRAVPKASEGNVQGASGRFSSIAHESKGKAAVVELPSGARKLTLSDFKPDPGPDLRPVRVHGATPPTATLASFATSAP